MCVHVLPYLLQMAQKCHQSSFLAQNLPAWAEKNASQVLNNLRVCKDLLPGNTNHLNKTKQNKQLNKSVIKSIF